MEAMIDDIMMKRLLDEALKRLDRAVKGLLAQTIPDTPLPRPRAFHLAPRSWWPYTHGLQDIVADGLTYPLSHEHNRMQASDRLLHAVARQPRAVLRLLRRLEAAAAWCDARRRGRERAAAELLRQQARATDTLGAMAAVQAISDGGTRQ